MRSQWTATWESLADKYKNASEPNTLRVRRYFRSAEKDRVKSGQSNIYGYVNGILETDQFYGAKNVSTAKLGQAIRPCPHNRRRADQAYRPLPLTECVELSHQEGGQQQPILCSARRVVSEPCWLVIVSAVIISLIVYTLTMDKLRSIATLKLIGTPDRTIIGLIVQQALAMGIIGSLAGLALLLGFKDYFPHRVVLLPEIVVLLFTITIIVCLVASALGVRVAVKVKPSAALAS